MNPNIHKTCRVNKLKSSLILSPISGEPVFNEYNIDKNKTNRPTQQTFNRQCLFLFSSDNRPPLFGISSTTRQEK